jgi:hypothetical protein
MFASVTHQYVIDINDVFFRESQEESFNLIIIKED